MLMDIFCSVKQVPAKELTQYVADRFAI